VWKDIYVLLLFRRGILFGFGGGVPRTKGRAVPRVNVRLPKPIVDEVDGIVRGSRLYVSRQQFIEAAVREKIERARLLKEGDGDAGLMSRVKSVFLAHALVNSVKWNDLPSDHLDFKLFEQRIRNYIVERLRRDGEEVTEERLDRLTAEVLDYHKELLRELRFLGGSR
jgi:Arc/MetJ-type ribon-helix-helix transcriptional regulator